MTQASFLILIRRKMAMVFVFILTFTLTGCVGIGITLVGIGVGGYLLTSSSDSEIYSDDVDYYWLGIGAAGAAFIAAGLTSDIISPEVAAEVQDTFDEAKQDIQESTRQTNAAVEEYNRRLAAAEERQREAAAQRQREAEAQGQQQAEAQGQQQAAAQGQREAAAQGQQEAAAQGQQEAEAQGQQQAAAQRQQEAEAQGQQEAAAQGQQEAAAQRQREAAAQRQRDAAEAQRQQEAAAQRQREAAAQRQRDAAEAQRQQEAAAQRQREAAAQRQRDAAEAQRQQEELESLQPAKAIRIASCVSGEGRSTLSVEEWKVEDGRQVDFQVMNTGNDNAYLIWITDDFIAPFYYAHLQLGESEAPIFPQNTTAGKVVIGYTDTGSGDYQMDQICSNETGLGDTMASIDWDELQENSLNIWYFEVDGSVIVERGAYAVTCDSGSRGYACGF